MISVRLKVLTALLLLLFSCEPGKESFQIIVTGEASDISQFGVTLHGKIINTTDEEILLYGFEWGGADNFPVGSTKFYFSEPIRNGNFSKRIESALYQDSIYFARAIALKNGVFVSGAIINFRSQGSLNPEIQGFWPKNVFAGDTVYIKGANFSPGSDNIVSIGTNRLTIAYSADSLIKALVPYSMPTLNSYLTVETAGMKAQSIDNINIAPTWVKIDANKTLNPAASNYGFNGFCIDENIYGDVPNLVEIEKSAA